MIKVLIVDDELLTRLALRTAIPWEEYGFEVTAEAEDGITGFQFVEKYRPEIVLTDISMPGMNGVELIKKIKAAYPDTEIIILSCHNDFEYVKEGLRSGAADYILKLSMSMEDLLKELLQLKEKILSRNIETAGTVSRPEREQWPRLLFSMITEEGELTDELLEKGRKAGLIGQEEYVITAAVAADGSEEEFANYNQKGVMENLAESVLARYKTGVYIPFENNRGVVLCQIEREQEYGEKLSDLKAMLTELLDLIHDYLGIGASAGIGGLNPVRQLRAGYQQAYAALSDKFYSGPGTLNLWGDKKQVREKSGPDGAFQELLKEISTYDFETVRFHAERWLDLVINCRFPDSGAVRKDIHELLFQIESTFLKPGGADSGLVEKAYHQLQKQGYAEEMRTTLREFLAEAESCCARVKESKREILMAKQYVGLHYQNNMKLTDVADYVGMNVDYFSHLFKKETGGSFTDYVNEFRIEKSKPLLQSGQIKVYEVAFAVGFQDENYFIRRFKKQTGYTPLEFMRL